MVMVNGIRFSCATCIKGHRASTCQHTDRPQIEIRKKGRPITQCAHCRELRKTKKLHIKCICAERAQLGKSSLPSCILPGGKRDSNGGMKVENLLNPCDCSKSSHCQCCEMICETPTTKYCRPKSDSNPTLENKDSIISSCCAPKLSNVYEEISLSNPINTEGLKPPTLFDENSDKKFNKDEKDSYCNLNDKLRADKFVKSIDGKISKKSYCACGCRSAISTSTIDSKLSLTNLLNPCNCCLSGKICICCRPSDIKANENSDPISLSKKGSCCGDTSEDSISPGLEMKGHYNNLASKDTTSLEIKSGGCCGNKPSKNSKILDDQKMMNSLTKEFELLTHEQTLLNSDFINPNLVTRIITAASEQQVHDLYDRAPPTTTTPPCCRPSIDESNNNINQNEVRVDTRCATCKEGCKCSSTGGGCCKRNRGPDTEYVDRDGIRTCGCGCYLSKNDCNDCLKDDCTEYIFGSNIQ